VVTTGLAAVAHHSWLEVQSISGFDLHAEIDELAAELIDHRGLWRDAAVHERASQSSHGASPCQTEREPPPRRTDGEASEVMEAELLDAHAGDGPANHQPLDLLGAFEDVVGLIWTCPQIYGGGHLYPLSWGNADH